MPPITRHTQQRRRVLAAVKFSHQPMSAEEVVQAIQRRGTRVSVSTVYRNLDLLADRGEIIRIVGPDGVTRFSGVPQSQAFFTCIRCGKVEALGVRLPRTTTVEGRAVLAVTTYYQGRCASCRRAVARYGKA